MKYYNQYFREEIKNITYLCLIISFFAVLFDERTSYNKYPEWISSFNFFLMGASIVLLLLSGIKKINIQHAFIFYIYLFTLNIYLPGLIADEKFRVLILSSFSNLGACMTYLFLAGFIGSGIHVLILGGLNIILNFSVSAVSYFDDPQISQPDPVNILMFALVSFVVYMFFKQIEKTLCENEKNKQRIHEYETEILKLKIEEENKRNYYLSVIQKENNLFVKKLMDDINQLLSDSDKDHKNEITNKLRQACLAHIYKTVQSENIRFNTETDADFIVKLRNNYPELTQKEQHICSLLRIHLNSKELADELKMSTNTVKWYRKRIRKKLMLSEKSNLSEYLNTL